jgi:molybdopterin-guanine dinucleotide biosynthesis protein
MAIVVVGGHTRNIGKTSVVAAIIARLPEMRWTAMKITQYGHGICSANGEPCDCATDDHTIAITAERDPNTGTDSARFLKAGAVRSLWVRTRQGSLADAMPGVRKEIARAENVIIESNSVMQFLRPDLFLTVLDYATADFKPSALRALDRADAILLRASGATLTPQWRGVSRKLFAEKPLFEIGPPEYMTEAVEEFVRLRMATVAARSIARG